MGSVFLAAVPAVKHNGVTDEHQRLHGERPARKNRRGYDGLQEGPGQNAAATLEKAVDWLRQKGLSKAAKQRRPRHLRRSRRQLNWQRRRQVRPWPVEVKCETDFVARGDKFQGFVQDTVAQVANGNTPTPKRCSPVLRGDDASVTVQRRT